MKSQNSRTLPEFNQYTIDLDNFCLRNGEVEVFFEPRLIRLLDFLCRNVNTVVKKKDIIDEVWKNVIVNEESLPRAILDLKRFLSTRFSNPPEIQTIRKVGYRLTLIQPIRKSRTIQSLRFAGKLIMIVVGICLFLIMLIRALNY